MKNICLTLGCLVLFSLSSLAQRKTTVRGSVRSYSFYQGGVESIEDFTNTIPFKMCVFVVKINSDTQIPEIVDSVWTDADGKFEIKLEPGTYGFVDDSDPSRLTVGQYLPQGWSQQGDISYSAVNWSANTQMPLVIRDVKEVQIELTRTYSNVCYVCP